MVIRQAAIGILILFGTGIPAWGAAAEEAARTFDEWEVTLGKSVYAALLSNTPTDTFQLFRHKGEGAVFGMMCDPAPGGSCVWVIAAKTPCDKGRPVFWNATFGAGEMARSSTKRLEASCAGVKDEYFQYVISDRDAAGLPALLGQVGGAATVFLDLELAQKPGQGAPYHFLVAGYAQAMAYLRVSLRLAQGAKPQARKRPGSL